MPKDCQDLAEPFDVCPKCGAVPFKPFMRGRVQRPKRFLGFLWRRDYMAVFCRGCKALVGWESPPGWRD